MKFAILTATMSLSIVFYSCTQETKVEKMQAEVMVIHDEVMPEMDNLMKLKNQLKNKIARFDSTGGSTNELNQLVKQLDEADEAMMQWMRNYKDPSPEMNEEQALEYLRAQKESISEVKKQINMSKAEAKEALSN